jgi:hypothetical protein
MLNLVVILICVLASTIRRTHSSETSIMTGRNHIVSIKCLSVEVRALECLLALPAIGASFVHRVIASSLICSLYQV